MNKLFDLTPIRVIRNDEQSFDTLLYNTKKPL